MDIQLITREKCVFCDDAKQLLSQNQFSFSERMIGRDIQREEVLSKYPTQKLLPVVVIDDRLVGGYKDLERWIDSNAA